MKSSIEVKAFKNELKNYLFYEKRLNSCKQQLEWCYSQLGGSARSPQFDAIPGEHNPYKNDVQLDREYRIREEIELWEDKIARTRIKLDDINNVLNKVVERCEDGELMREAMFEMYAKGKPVRKLAVKYGFSKTNLLDKMNKAIKKALE